MKFSHSKALLFVAVLAPAWFLPHHVFAQWQEPDDVREFARFAWPDSETQSEVSFEGDVDWFRIAVPRASFLTLSDVDAAVQYQLVDSLGDEVSSESDSDRFVVEPGIYFLGISGPVRQDPYQFRYTLEQAIGLMRLGLAPGDPKPAAGAYRIATGTRESPVQFSLQLTDAAEFRVQIAAASADAADYRMRISDEDGNAWPEARFWQIDPGGQAVAKEFSRHLAPGNYTVSLFRSTVTTDEADVSFTTAPPNDGFEPNDTLDFAKQLELPATGISLTLFPGDEDWFEFETGAAGILEIRGSAEAGTQWSDVSWPTVYRADSPSTAIDYYFSESGLARYWLQSPGRFLIRAPAPSRSRVVWRMTAGFEPAAERDGNLTDFFVMGLEAEPELATTLETMAEMAGGRSYAVDSDEMDLGLSLASIVSQSKGETLGISGYIRTVLQVVRNGFFDPGKTEFDPSALLGSERLVEQRVFAEQGNGGDLAFLAKEIFSERALSLLNNDE